MEKKKKRRGIPLPDSGPSDAAAPAPAPPPSQNGDGHTWQAETDGNPSSKKLASGDSPTTQAYFPPFHWPFAHQHPLGQAQLPHMRMLGDMSQAPQGAHQSLPTEGAGVNPPLPSASAETPWQQGAPRPLPPFSFLPPPFPGPWDLWWAHTPYPPPFPYLFPGYGNGYPCPPPPPVPSVGANQRGLIKPPSGLSQKHVQIWEAQSMENMQLWTTTTQLWAAVARADAEISLQRGKIIKLEADVQAMKAHRTEPAHVTPQSVTKRAQRKRVAPASSPVPASSGISDRASVPVRKGKMNAENLSSTRRKELEVEEKEKYTNACQAIEEVCQPKECSLNEGELLKSPQKHLGGDYQGAAYGIDPMPKDGLAFSQVGRHHHHLNHFRPSTFHGAGKDAFDQSLAMKENVVNFLKSSGCVDPPLQGTMTRDSSSFMGAMSQAQANPCVRSMNGYAARKDGINARSSLPGGHFNGSCDNIEETNTLGLQKVIPGWRYRGEDGSEQDDAVASARDDDELDDDDDDEDEDDESNLDDMHNSGKVGNCAVLDHHLSMKWQ